MSEVCNVSCSGLRTEGALYIRRPQALTFSDNTGSAAYRKAKAICRHGSLQLRQPLVREENIRWINIVGAS